LRGLGSTPRAPSPAALQLLDVITSLGIVRPLLGLLVRDLVITLHDKIV
jgi:hypothetical protein